MKQMKNVYFTIAWIASIILGVLFSLTIVGLILGIPLFIASAKFKKAINMTDDELIKNRNNLFGWGIFLAIIFAPSVIG